jgi:hypothetical protein
MGTSEIHFRDNYNDLSTNGGFQFEFYCERCHDAWRSPFDRYAAGTMESVLGAAEGLFGGIFGSARHALSSVSSAGYSKAKDEALRIATERAADHFHRCPRCSDHFCDSCWNAEEGTCISCVPRLDAEIAAITREAQVAKAREEAHARATVSPEDLARRVVACPACGAAAGRGKFCQECGAPISLERRCGSCDATVPAASKFCPECGAKA